MILKINVTQTDILRGVKRNCHLCPVARAVKRAAINAELDTNNDRVEVSPGHIIIHTNEKRYVALTPDKMREFIQDFDTTGEVKKIRCELEFKIYNKRINREIITEVD